MSKTCPNCGVNSPDNAKFCIECAHSLEDVPINKEEKPPQKKEESEGSVALGCAIMIVIVAIVIVAVGFLFLGWGGNNGNPDAITITFGDVYAFESKGSNGNTYYNYYVNGYFDKMPNDVDKYMIKTKYCDSSGKELTSTSDRLSKFKNDVGKQYASLISTYQTPNFINVDHVCVQIIKDNKTVQEFNSTVNMNKMTSIPNSSNSTNTSK